MGKVKTRYERLQQDVKNVYTEINYFNFLLQSLCTMFTWTGLPVEQRHLEEYLHCNASFGVQASDAVPEGFLFAPEPSRQGNPELDQFAEGRHIHGVCLGGMHQIDGIENETVVLCFNNCLHTNDFDMIQYANTLASVDRAMSVNTRLSGFAPILLASDSKNEKSLQNMMTQLLDGQVCVIKEAEAFDNLLTNGQNQTQGIDIVEPARVANVQYQSQLWYDYLRRFFSKYGIDIQTNNKRAQVSKDETNALDAFSWIVPLDMLHERQEFCKRMYEVFGVQWSVDFSDLWKTEFEKYKRVQEEGEEDDSEGDADGVGSDDTAGESGDKEE